MQAMMEDSYLGFAYTCRFLYEYETITYMRDKVLLTIVGMFS